MDYPKDASVGLLNGKFTDGNPLLGIPASRDPASWANAVTDEILAVVTSAGLVPNEAVTNQLLQAINAKITAAIPASPADASPTIKGILKLATQAITDAGVDNATGITPLVLAATLRNRIATAGHFVNLKVSCTGADPTILISADQLVVGDGIGNARILRSVGVSINTAASGLNGLDTSTSAANTWYYAFVIFNPATSSVAAVASLSPTAPSLPAGYTHFVRVGAYRTGAGSARLPLSFIQAGRSVRYKIEAVGNVTELPVMASGLAGSPETPTFVSVAVQAFVPPTATAVSVRTTRIVSGGRVVVAPSALYGPPVTDTRATAPIAISGTTAFGMAPSADIVLESGNIYWASSISTVALLCVGWEDSI
ncbi:hypothetical protein FBY21_1167 [Pseudomonas sp. SLBN-26]|uniref:hypothetical protein n=1 Tax=Pseudomonadaceae TaxID=135621 RepID=UPI00114ED30A|nr:MULTISPECIES: hypothetical protein [Pseudomonas]MCP1616560.1 hypothetical protein [Pseudomonas otitidis]TQL05816.1 hypothetical protein FBY21_1167 [Pseudomonas sp. SLBN-26]